MANTNYYTLQEIFNLAYDETTGGFKIAGAITGDLTLSGNLEVAGYFDLGDSVSDTFTISGYIQGLVAPSGLGYVSIGNTATSHSLDATDDLMVSGELEVNGQAFFDGNMRISDNINLAFGNSFDASWDWSTTQASANTLMCGVGATANSVIFTNQANVNKDHDHAAETNPTIFIHSATDPDTANDQWGSLTHTTTAFVLDSGKEKIQMSATTLQNDGNFIQVGQNFNFGSQGADASSFRFTGTFDQLNLFLGADYGRQLVIGDPTGLTQDYDHATPTHPTVYIHSATQPDVANDEYGALYHDGTRFWIESGKSLVSFSDTIESRSYLGINNANTTYAFLGTGVDDGVRLGLRMGDNEDNGHFILTTSDNKAKDHDHDTLSTNPTMFIHSATDPDVSNNEWGSISHDGNNLIIESGANTGTGSGPTVKNNGVSLVLSALDDADIFNSGFSVSRELNDSVAAAANETFSLIGGVTVETDTSGWKRKHLLNLSSTGIPGAPILGAFDKMAGLITQNDNAIGGVQFKNENSGTSAEMRFIVANNGNDYLAVTSPGANNTGTFIGMTKSTADFIFASDRHLGIFTNNTKDLVFGTGNTERARFIDGNGLNMLSALQAGQGADVASANDVALGKDGNVFEITGTTQINRLDIDGWQPGAEVTLLFNASVTVKHGQASGGTNTTILLAGGADFSATVDDMLTLVLCENTATGMAWREKCRTAI